MVVGLVASLVSSLVHSSKSKTATPDQHPADQAAYPQERAHGTSCARNCSTCAVVPSLATRHERKQDRKDRRCARRMDRRVERGMRRGYYPPGVVVQPTVSVGGYPTMSGQSYGVRPQQYAEVPRQEARRAERHSEESQERGFMDGDLPPPYEQGETHRAVDEKTEGRQ